MIDKNNNTTILLCSLNYRIHADAWCKRRSEVAEGLMREGGARMQHKLCFLNKLNTIMCYFT